MNKDLEQLVQLSQFDKDIVGFEPKIQSENDKLKVFLKEVDNLNSKIEVITTDIQEATSKKIRNELNLKDLQTKLEEISSKYDVIKTEKESRALQLEEEISKEQISFCNDEINRLDNIISIKNEELIELKKDLEEEQNNVSELKTNVDKTIEELILQRSEVVKNQAKLIDTIDSKVLVFYKKIKLWAKETAVAPIKNQACYGCYMKLTNKSYSEFLATDEITTCPHCGRIVYKSNEES